MEPILSTIAAAVVAGASAKAKDVASRVVSDAYEALRAALIRKFGKVETLQGIEHEPQSRLAQTSVVEMLANQRSAIDTELKHLAEAMSIALAETRDGSQDEKGSIDVEGVRGGIDAIVEELSARGTIRLGSVVAETGSARVSGLTAGADIATIVSSGAYSSRASKEREKN
jgi:hypothetical protein